MNREEVVRGLLAEMRGELASRTLDNAPTVDARIYCLSHMVAYHARECSLPELHWFQHGASSSGG